MLSAYALGIVTGTQPGLFSPSRALTRQEVATMLGRTAAVLGLTPGPGETFRDAGSFASWAAEGIAAVSGLADATTGNKVMGGVGNGFFDPTASYTVEQAIISALRLYRAA